MKPKIKFSHDYYKFPPLMKWEGEWKHKVFHIAVVDDICKLPKEFLEYDTAYWDMKALKTKHYPLDFKKGIMIFIISQDARLGYYEGVWTTIRRWTPKKEAYYQSLVGKEVDIVIEKDGD